MKVFILEWFDGEATQFLGVYETEDAAKKRKESHKERINKIGYFEVRDGDYNIFDTDVLK